MRILTIFSIFFFGFGAVLVAQPPGGGRGGQGGGPPFDRAQIQQGDGGPQQRMQGGQPGMQGGQQPPWMQNAAPAGGPPGGGPAGRSAPPNATQGNQPLRPGQPVAGQTNPDQVTRTMARLRAMDANGNGVLEDNEIPANQQDRVNMMVTQLGGNLGSQINLATLERRAMAAAGNTQPNQQQRGENTREQQRQQPVDPLVLPFGEMVAAVAPALGFGQRERVVQTAQTNTPQTNARGGRQQGDATNQQNSVSQPTIVKVSTPYDNIPAALRSSQEFKWFFDFDTDQNGQLSMLEYVNGCGGIWSAGIASEFVGYETTRNGEKTWVSGLDRNGDGFATMDEALMTVKERTELRVQEEQAARQQGQPGQPGQQGRQPPVVSRSSRQMPETQAGNAAPSPYQGRQQTGRGSRSGRGG